MAREGGGARATSRPAMAALQIGIFAKSRKVRAARGRASHVADVDRGDEGVGDQPVAALAQIVENLAAHPAPEREVVVLDDQEEGREG